MRYVRFLSALLTLLGLVSGHASAQWNPTGGQWGKNDPTHLRVMTWNVLDGICSSNNAKTDATNRWNALVRVVAAFQPDVLVLQECGDNNAYSGSGTVDSVANLTTTIGLFINGGNDPFIAGNPPVTSYLKKFAPSYDLPYVLVSDISDNYNRNVILSRYPFVDLNGDTRTYITNFFIFADAYAPGGNGGIRGFAFAEIDLPDAVYAGDLVVGTGHLKAGGASGDLADRLAAAKNIAYYIDYIFNAAGGTTPDPNNKVLDSPTITLRLDANTPVIWGGDMNEDENTNGRKGPVEWMTNAATTGGTDGTDRNRSDSTYDSAVEPFTGNRKTQGSSSKLDYIMYQDSIATAVVQATFNSASVTAGKHPYPVSTFPPVASLASSSASDHLPVIVDFSLPLAPPPPPLCPADVNGDTSVDVVDFLDYLDAFGQCDSLPGPCIPPGSVVDADFNGDTAVDVVDFLDFLDAFGQTEGPCPT